MQLIYALHTALKTILTSSPSLEERFALHKKASNKVKDTLTEAGFECIPLNRDIAANGMSAVKYPNGLSAGDILPKLVA